jgi:hypothetical protein
MALIGDAGCVPHDTAPSRTLLRRFTLGSGPLKRASDRVEVAIRVVVLGLLLLAAPAGLLVGTAVSGHLHAGAAAATAALHREPATLLADARPTGDAARRTVPTSAAWAAPDGTARAGEVDAPSGARAGTTVEVWLRDDGTPVTAPATDRVITAQAVVSGFLTAVGLLVAAGSGQLLAGWGLDRHRARRWAADWATVEPLWAGRSR